MPVAVSPSESQVQAALIAFCQDVLPSGTPIVEALDNRVPEPQASAFAELTPLRRQILATNIHATLDCVFDASISGTTMTVGSVDVHNGVGILAGAAVSGPAVAAGTSVVSQTSGSPGGAGVYVVTPSQSVPDATLQAGQLQVTGMFELAVQLGFHAANNTSADMAQAVAQMLRDPYGVAFITGQNAAVTALFASAPRMVPFINAEEQFEWRWVVEAILQANITITGLGQQFSTSADLTLIDVDILPPINIFHLDDSILDGSDVLG